MPQIDLFFPGITGWIRAEYAKTKGTQPSMCIVWTEVFPQLDSAVGTLTLQYGSIGVNMSNCAVRTSHIRREHFRNAYVWRIPIMDRRWKWAYCRISGEYNRRLPDNAVDDSIDNNKLSAQQLGAILMEALGETNYDVSALPADVYPYVRWVDSFAAAEFSSLCDFCHCDPDLALGSDQAVVWQRGVGASLPTTDLVSPIVPLLPSEKPAGIMGCCGDTRYQTKWLMEAVGLDIDGSWKPIDDLSYKPTDGWTKDWPSFFPNVDQEARHLAFWSVFRCYRIKEQATGGLAPPGCQEEVASIEQALPLYDTLIDYAEDSEDGRKIPLPPYIQGEFWPQCDHPINTPAVAALSWDFTLFNELGIIRLPYPAVKFNDDGDQIEEAKLWLTCSYRIRKLDRDYVSAEVARPLSFITPTAYVPIKHPEIWEAFIQDFSNNDPEDPAGVRNNTASVSQEIGEYLNRAELEWTRRFIADAWYGGLVLINTDGSLPQVVWSFGIEEDPLTRICLEQEMDTYVPSPDERRRKDRLTRLQERSVEYAPPRQ